METEDNVKPVKYGLFFFFLDLYDHVIIDKWTFIASVWQEVQPADRRSQHRDVDGWCDPSLASHQLQTVEEWMSEF